MIGESQSAKPVSSTIQCFAPFTSSVGSTYVWMMPFTAGIGSYTANVTVVNTANSTFNQVGLCVFPGSTGVIDNTSVWTVPGNATAPLLVTSPSTLRIRETEQGYPINFVWQGPSSSIMRLGVVDAQIYGSTSQPLGTNLAAATIASGATVYFGPSNSSATTVTTQSLQEVPIPYPNGATAKNLMYYMSTANAAGGNFVMSLVKNESATPLALTATAPLSSIANTMYADTTHTVTLVQGDRIAWKGVNNNGAAATGAFHGISMELVPSGNATGMVVFGSSGLTIPSAGTTYGVPFTDGENLTESTARAGVPLATVAVNLACLVTTAPLLEPQVVTLYHNGSGSTITLSIPTSQSVPGVVADYYASTGHNVSLAAGDTFSLQFTQLATGTAAVISSCALEFASAAE